MARYSKAMVQASRKRLCLYEFTNIYKQTNKQTNDNFTKWCFSHHNSPIIGSFTAAVIGTELAKVPAPP